MAAKTLKLDHVGVVVEDLDGAVAFFTALGMSIEGRAPIEGKWADRINAIDGLQVDIVMMRTADGQGLELTRFRNPALVKVEPAVQPPNAAGLRNVMFQVDDVDASVAALARHGGVLIGEIVNYEDVYRLCYVRGPAGIIVALAQPLG
jgi:catechol 2,3-dioxygenase-like lactoylglutathione lyase family enzyme